MKLSARIHWKWPETRGDDMTTSTEQHVFTEDGTEDIRYSVKEENTGHPDGPWYAARFEGHWVGEKTTEEDAWAMARRHAKGRG
jgi:hypothetical protein